MHIKKDKNFTCVLIVKLITGQENFLNYFQSLKGNRMNIVEIILERKSRLMMCYNITPKYLYVGEYEYKELKDMNKYYNFFDIEYRNDKEFCCELEIIKVDKQNHFNVF